MTHVHFLRAARAVDPRRSVVVVGVENDENVRLRKGRNRPINTAEERMDVLAEFGSVDYVFMYPDTPRYDHPEDFLARYRETSAAALVVPDWDPYLGLKQDQASDVDMDIAVVHYEFFRNSTTTMLQAVGFQE